MTHIQIDARLHEADPIMRDLIAVITHPFSESQEGVATVQLGIQSEGIDILDRRRSIAHRIRTQVEHDIQEIIETVREAYNLYPTFPITAYFRIFHEEFSKEAQHNAKLRQQVHKELVAVGQRLLIASDGDEHALLTQRQSHLQGNLEEKGVQDAVVKRILEKLTILQNQLMNEARRRQVAEYPPRRSSHQSQLTITGDSTVDMYNAIHQLKGLDVMPLPSHASRFAGALFKIFKVGFAISVVAIIGTVMALKLH